MFKNGKCGFLLGINGKEHVTIPFIIYKKSIVFRNIQISENNALIFITFYQFYFNLAHQEHPS